MVKVLPPGIGTAEFVPSCLYHWMVACGRPDDVSHTNLQGKFSMTVTEDVVGLVTSTLVIGTGNIDENMFTYVRKGKIEHVTK